MNAQIQRLVEQTGLCVNLNGRPYPQALSAEQTEVALQKFVELIVKECGIVADQWVNDEDNGRNLVSAKLKQHFGVEE